MINNIRFGLGGEFVIDFKRLEKHLMLNFKKWSYLSADKI
jgi:hypothetical protein